MAWGLAEGRLARALARLLRALFPQQHVIIRAVHDRAREHLDENPIAVERRKVAGGKKDSIHVCSEETAFSAAAEPGLAGPT